MTPVAVIVVSDTHINSTVAIARPGVVLDDGNTVEPSRPCKILYSHFVDFCAWAEAYTAGCHRVIVLNGDIVEGDAKKRSAQVYTRNRASIIRLAAETLEPLTRLADGLFVVRGTEAHVGKSGELEELLAVDLGAISSTPIKSHYHLQQVFGGVKFDISHHASMGGRPWTAKNAANNLAAMYQYDSMRPDVIIRSHVHRWSDSGHNWPWLTMTIPSWQLPTSYVHSLSTTGAEFGGVAFICEDGRYRWERKLFEVRRQWQTYKV